jgi:hypothetical protein
MTPRYKLRTLLILVAILPPLLAVSWWKYSAWKAEQERWKALEAERASVLRSQYSWQRTRRRPGWTATPPPPGEKASDTDQLRYLITNSTLRGERGQFQNQPNVPSVAKASTRPGGKNSRARISRGRNPESAGPVGGPSPLLLPLPPTSPCNYPRLDAAVRGGGNYER